MRKVIISQVLALQRLQSLAFGFGTFAYAKDQASSPLDGLLRKTRHLPDDIFGINTQYPQRG